MRAAAKGQDDSEQTVIGSFGFLGTWNTDVGLKHPEMVTWLQEGVRGEELQSRVRKLPLLINFFERFKSRIQALCAASGLLTWAVCMQYGGNSKHPGRIHVHAAGGVPDISREFLSETLPPMVLLKKGDFVFEGCHKPYVSFTTFQRPSVKRIMNSVATSMYYVAGPRIGTVFKHTTAEPFKATQYTKH